MGIKLKERRGGGKSGERDGYGCLGEVQMQRDMVGRRYNRGFFSTNTMMVAARKKHQKE